MASNRAAIEVIRDRHEFDDVNSPSDLTRMAYIRHDQLKSTNISLAAKELKSV